MEKKRALLLNVLVIAALLLLCLALLAVTKLTPRRIEINAGPLEMEFEPAVTTQAPSAHERWNPNEAQEEMI